MSLRINTLAAIAFALAVAPFAASAQSTPSTGTAAPAAVLPTQGNPANAELSPTDANFVKQAAIGGLSEVQEGKLASQRGDRAAKKVGDQMVIDHTHANDELVGITKSQNLDIPTQPDATHAAQFAQLQKLRGKAFDNAYLNHQLLAHQQTIAVFQQEADQGSDPQLKAFAARTLPILQGHLAMVKSALHQTS